MRNTSWLAMAALLVAGVSAGTAPAQEVTVTPTILEEGDGWTIIQWEIIKKCYNYSIRDTCEECVDGSIDTVSGLSGNQEICSTISVINSKDPHIDNSALNHHHIASDYRLAMPTPGCCSCGGSNAQGGLGVSGLEIERRHRLRDQTWQSSFGPGVYSNYDTKLVLYSSGGGNVVDIFDPREDWPKRLVDGLSGDVPDGIFIDARGKAIKELRLLDASGVLTTDVASAKQAVVTNYQGQKHIFEIIDMSSPHDSSDGDALVRWRLDEGDGTSTADSTGHGHNGVLQGGAAWVDGVSGKAVEFNGTSGYVSCGNPAALNFTGPITIAAWVKAEASDGLRNIVAHGYAQNPKGEVALRIQNGNYRMGSWDGPDHYVTVPMVQGDVGTWVHLVGVYGGNRWLIYRNGTLLAARQETTGAVPVAGNWAIGATGAGDGRFFQGAIDDVRIYDRELTPDEIRTLANQQRQPAGRLTSIVDRNGYGTTLTYKTFTPQQIADSPDRQWQIDNVTDAFGRQAQFTYGDQQVSGRWAVSEIDVPGARSIQYIYTDGRLSEVQHPDGATSTIDYAPHAQSQTTAVTYNDPAVESGRRKKTVYLTNSLVMSNIAGDLANAEVYNQSSLMVRMVTSDSGEVVYLNFPNPNHPSLNETAIYEGAGKLKLIHGTWSARYWQDGWTLSDPSTGFAGIEGALEPTYVDTWLTGQSHTNYNRGTLPYLVDARGNLYSYSYDSDTFVIRKNYADSTAETFQYNQFKQVTHHSDRLGRVTKFTYDAQGNRLTKEVGIVNTRVYGQANPNFGAWPVDVQVTVANGFASDEYAVFAWQYYGESETVDGVIQPKGLLKATLDADGNATRHVYNDRKLLWRVYEPDDEGTGDHLAHELVYDANGRMQASTDAMGRTVEFAYDARDRHVQTIYADGSTDETLYGTGDEANLAIARKDRNGSVSIIRYDAEGRTTESVAAASNVGPLGTILQGYNRPDSQQYLPEAAVTTLTYLEGTKLPLTATSRGEATTYTYDYRHRQIETRVQPQVGRTLVSRRTYRNNELFSMEDPFGRNSYNAYRASDGALIRTVQATVPQFTLADPAAVLALMRDQGPNATHLISDYEYNAAGETVATIDPRNVRSVTVFDTRRRAIEQIAAFGTAVAAKTQTVYDADGNVLEVRSPRYFDSNDANGFQKASEQWTYTRRDLRKSHTVAAGDAAYPAGAKVTQSWTYNLDRTVDTHTDFRGNAWETLWSLCCSARVTAKVDPLGAANTSDYDSYGNVTHSQRLHGETVFNQTTTRYDVRHRPVASTVWLVPQQVASPQNPPIAGGGLAGDPAAHDAQGNTVGLTTRYLYDEDLTDGVGLDSAQGVSLPKLKDQGTLSVSIASLLAEMNADLADGQPVLGTGCNGSATVVLNPEDEISVSIQDGAGRPIATGIIRQDGTPITWQTVKHDAVVAIAGYGDVVETAQIDALNHVTRSRTDGAGRTIESLDALGEVTSLKYDANGNTLSVRDPNNIGWDAGTALGTFNGYDALNRLTAQIDTQGDTAGTGYNANGNIVRSTDAKSQNTLFAYDARGQKVSMTDRISGLTTWKYDQNGNVLELCDADNQAANKPTVWTYDARNMKLTEAYPGHNPASQVNDADYDQKIFGYDLAGRPATFTDQQGDTVTHGFDMAGRLVQRDYRLAVNSPEGQIADSDVHAYDDAGRLIAATSGRYNNTVSLAYADGAGRLTAESLAVDFGQPRTYTVGSQYDAANRRTEITYPDGSVVVRAYTARDQLEQIDYNAGMVATFAYDDGGRRTTRTLGDQPGTVTTWAYGRQDNLVTGISTANVTSFTYTYDANKNKLTETIGGVMQPYGFTVPQNGYDADDRLVGWNRDDSQKNQSWDLSLAGDWNQFTENAVTQTRSHNNVHELTGIDQTPLAHDAKGNLTFNVNAQAYTWDFDNRLSSATVGPNTHGYTYDALGRRVSKTVMTAGGTGQQVSEAFVFVNSIHPLEHSPDAGQEVVEYAANAEPAAPLRKFVYAEYVDEPVLILTTGGEAEVKHYCHANDLYSVAVLTDQNGTVVERYAYSAYGHPLFFDGAGTLQIPQPAGSVLANPYLFTGRRLDSETTLTYSRARYYSFDLGRFIGRDPLAYGAKDINLYRYVHNNPVILVDPAGLDAGLPFATPQGQDDFVAGYLGKPKSERPSRSLDLPVPDRGKCTIALECIRALGINTGPRHCGIIMKYYIADGTLTTIHLHARGWMAEGGSGNGCRVQWSHTTPDASGSGAGGEYHLRGTGYYPVAKCSCILDAMKKLNAFMDSGGDNYSLLPKDNPCKDEKPQCNSNSSAACLLRHCGLDIKPPGSAPGWGHRMKQCTDGSFWYMGGDDRGDFQKCCSCTRWKPVDTDWCGPAQ